MSTLHKVKAYFGMVPMDSEYDDDYLEERDERARREEPRPRRAPARYRGEYADDRGYSDDRYAPEYDDQYEEDSRYERAPEYAYAGAARADYAGSARGDFGGSARGEFSGPARAAEYAGSPRTELVAERAEFADERPGLRAVSRLEPLPARAAAGRTPAPMTRGALAVDTAHEEAEEAGPLTKITTVRPTDYTEARIIGERFRDGSPVIMDLVDMSNADAKRLVDFAAGLVLGLRGSFDKVATKVFLLSPADVDVTQEAKRRIAEKGFYNQK